MNQYVVGVGSNTDPQVNVGKAIRLLEESLGSILRTEIIETEPIEMNNDLPFLNTVIMVRSEKTAEQMSSLLKEMERTIGRKPEDKKQGIIRIDLDIICINGEVVNDDYYEKEFLRELIPPSFRPFGS